MIGETFCGLVMQLRSRTSLTQRELADRSGIVQPTIAKIEKGIADEESAIAQHEKREYHRQQASGDQLCHQRRLIGNRAVG